MAFGSEGSAGENGGSAGEADEAVTSQGRAARRKRRYPLYAKLGLSVATMAALFVVGEVGLRLVGAKPPTPTVLTALFQYDPMTGWRGVPGIERHQATIDFDVLISHDADGMRRSLEPTIDEEAAAIAGGDVEGELVWCLGDSFTWGWGVEAGETFVDRLNATSEGRRRFRNLGQPGYGAVQQYTQLKDYFERGAKPDRVVVYFRPNDLWDNVGASENRQRRPLVAFRDGEAELVNYPAAPNRKFQVKTWVRRNSLVYNYVYYYLRRAQLGARTSLQSPVRSESQVGHVSELYRDVEYADECWQAADVAFGWMAELCAAEDVTLSVAFEGSGHIAKRLRATCEGAGISYLDLAPAFDRYYASTDAPEAVRFDWDPHFNALGHRLVAKGIDEALEQLRMAEVESTTTR